MTRLGFILALFVSFSVVPNWGMAQLSDADRERLAVEVETAANQLDVDLFPDLEASKAAFRNQADSVKRYFDRTTDADNRDAWLRYLDLDPLLNAINSGAQPNQIGEAAVEVRHRLIGTAPGLELRAVNNLRDSVEQLIDSARFHDRERAKEALTKPLQSLAKRIREMDENPSADEFAAVSAIVGLVKSSGQAAPLIGSLRQTFDQPNMAVMVSESMVQQAVNQEVDETRPVCECILGTRIIGDAMMTGTVTADLIPSASVARINVTLVGHVDSRNRGYNGPVRLRTIGNGGVNASRIVRLDHSGVALEPPVTHVTLNTQITAIEHKSKLVRKLARKKAAKQKPKADRIALGKMRRQVSDQFASQTREAIDVESPEQLEEARRVLKRLALKEPTQHWSSTDQEICVEAVFRRDDQLSCVVSRPAIDVAYDVAVQIHESVLDNALTPVLAGRTVNEGELDELLEKSGRPTPESASDDEEDDSPFEIDFARLRPVIFEARDNSLRLGVRGTRFAQGKRVLKKAMEITAVYVPAEVDGVVTLVRQGEVDVDFPGGRRLTVQEAGLKRTIQKKFSKVFPASVLDRPIEVPNDAKIEPLQGRVFHPRLVAAVDGWLTIAVR